MAIFTAIGAAVSSIAAAVGFGAAAAAAIGATAARFALSVTFSLVARALGPKGGGSSGQSVPKLEVQATLSQAAGARTRLYGRGLLGGTRAFWETKGNKLYQIIALNHTPLSTALAFWIDGRPVAVDGSSNLVTSEPFQGSDVSILYKDGTGGGGNYPDVVAEFPALWTANHKLTNQATLQTTFTAPAAAEYNKRFPRGPNTQIQVEAEGAAVFDFRSSQSAYSDNASLCIADFLTHADGFRIPSNKIDTQQFSDFADLCDEVVSLKSGGTEPRYRLWGAYSLQDDPKAVLGRMSLTCDASVYQTPEGKVGIIGGKFSVPDVTITDDDIFSFEKVEGDSAIDGFNVLKGIFTSADHDYQDAEAQAWENTASLATQPERADEVSADMVPSHGQMRRILKQQIHKGNRLWTGRLVTNLVGFKARFPKGDGIHTIRVKYSGLGIDEVVEVLGHTIVAEKSGDGVIIWKCIIDVAQVSSDWYDWDPITEEGDPPAEPERPAVEGTPTPAITSLTQDTSNKAVVVVSDISRPDLDLDAQIREVGEAEWSAMFETGLRAESGALNAGTNYEVQVRFKGGAWSAAQNISIT